MIPRIVAAAEPVEAAEAAVAAVVVAAVVRGNRVVEVFEVVVVPEKAGHIEAAVVAAAVDSNQGDIEVGGTALPPTVLETAAHEVLAEVAQYNVAATVPTAAAVVVCAGIVGIVVGTGAFLGMAEIAAAVAVVAIGTAVLVA